MENNNPKYSEKEEKYIQTLQKRSLIINKYRQPNSILLKNDKIIKKYFKILFGSLILISVLFMIINFPNKDKYSNNVNAINIELQYLNWEIIDSIYEYRENKDPEDFKIKVNDLYDRNQDLLKKNDELFSSYKGIYKHQESLIKSDINNIIRYNMKFLEKLYGNYNNEKIVKDYESKTKRRMTELLESYLKLLRSKKIEYNIDESNNSENLFENIISIKGELNE